MKKSVQIEFPVATEDWGVITHAFVDGLDEDNNYVSFIVEFNEVKE